MKVWEGVSLVDGLVKYGPYLTSTNYWTVINKTANIIISDIYQDMGPPYFFIILLNLSNFLERVLTSESN